jgi:hypothetical protein
LSKKVTTSDFIKHAQEVHGNKYDYSKTNYISAITNITIICPIHGEFQQRPANHYSGKGCRECGGNKPLTLKRFIERSNKIHYNHYDYSLTEFKSVEDKVKIICPTHGTFSQKVMSHLRGFNCPQCGRESVANKLSHSQERFIHDAKIAHGDKFDYSEVVYKNAQTKVRIICPEHGPFLQRPANHIRDIGCSKCSDIVAGEQRRRTTDEFINLAKQAHGDKYDYSKVNYITSHEKVEIICPEHGSFWQNAVAHIEGFKSGCPGCAISGFDQTKSALLYYLAVLTDNDETLYKIGITNLTVKRRFSVADFARIRIIKTWSYEQGIDAANREISILREFSDDLYTGADILASGGNTELFIRDVLKLDPEENIKPYKK